jgi:hypothetical protein
MGLTIGEHADVDLLDTFGHGVFVWQSFDEDSVNADALELFSARHGFVPTEDERVGSGKDEDVFAFVTSVNGGLNAGECLAS